MAQPLVDQGLELKREADGLYGQSRFEEALEVYTNADLSLSQADVDSDSVRKVTVVRVFLLQGQAACLQKMNKHEEAIERCSTALELDPSAERSLHRRAHCALACGRYAEAYGDFLQLSALSPNMPDAAKQLQFIKSQHPEVAERVEADQPSHRRPRARVGGMRGAFLRSLGLVYSGAMTLSWWLTGTMLLGIVSKRGFQAKGAESFYESVSTLMSSLLIVSLMEPLNLVLGTLTVGSETPRSMLLCRSLTAAAWYLAINEAPATKTDTLLLLLSVVWSTKAILHHGPVMMEHVVPLPAAAEALVDWSRSILQPISHFLEYAMIWRSLPDFHRANSASLLHYSLSLYPIAALGAYYLSTRDGRPRPQTSSKRL